MADVFGGDSLTEAGAAKLLGLNENQVRHMCRRGILPAQPSGQTRWQYIIQRADVMERQRVADETGQSAFQEFREDERSGREL